MAYLQPTGYPDGEASGEDEGDMYQNGSLVATERIIQIGTYADVDSRRVADIDIQHTEERHLLEMAQIAHNERVSAAAAMFKIREMERVEEMKATAAQREEEARTAAHQRQQNIFDIQAQMEIDNIQNTYARGVSQEQMNSSIKKRSAKRIRSYSSSSLPNVRDSHGQERRAYIRELEEQVVTVLNILSPHDKIIMQLTLERTLRYYLKTFLVKSRWAGDTKIRDAAVTLRSGHFSLDQVVDSGHKVAFYKQHTSIFFLVRFCLIIYTPELKLSEDPTENEVEVYQNAVNDVAGYMDTFILNWSQLYSDLWNSKDEKSSSRYRNLLKAAETKFTLLYGCYPLFI